MSLKIIYLLSACFLILGCSTEPKDQEKAKEVLDIKEDTLRTQKPKLAVVKNTTLTIEDYFVLQVSVDSIKGEINAENYEQLAKALSTKVSISLGEEYSATKLYKYKTIDFNQKIALELITNGASFGYNSVFATLIDKEQEIVLNSILIAKVSGDVGDVNSIESTIISAEGKLMIGVYKRYITDDFLMGNSEGIYKVHHDSLLLYEVREDGMTLKAAKSGI